MPPLSPIDPTMPPLLPTEPEDTLHVLECGPQEAHGRVCTVNDRSIKVDVSIPIPYCK